jgi:uncharacterized repeat protein (TIGR03803 family)
MFHVRRPGLIVVVSFLLACRWGIASGQTLTTLWQFGSLSNEVDGVSPWAGLVQGSDGNFYGTAGGTGVVHCTVFKITSAGTLTPLWQFGSLSNNADGNTLLAGLVQGSDGDFYGTAAQGGTNTFPYYGFGTVFKITSAGTLTPLWQFGSLSNHVDGIWPWAGLVQGSDGSFYGTTGGGGTNTTCYGGCGTVFKITPAGTLTTLWQFGGSPNNADGYYPEAGLIQGSDGDFYGTTAQGGTNTYSSYGYGTVFKITPAGTLTPLWQFGSLSNRADGARPYAGLVQGSDGNFYGTTSQGGTNTPYNNGTVFKITPAGTFTPLWQFGSLPNRADGIIPMAGLVQGSDGSFYGTTAFGGTNDFGTVFKLTVPLNPPANQISGICIADTNIVLTIPSVAGETYQLQYSADLASGDWSNIVDACVSNSIGALLTFTNFGGASSSQGFYRFDITP